MKDTLYTVSAVILFIVTPAIIEEKPLAAFGLVAAAGIFVRLAESIKKRRSGATNTRTARCSCKAT